MNNFFTSQFSYCPLVQLFHSLTMNNEINRMSKVSRLVVYKDKISEETFRNIGTERSASIHTRNLSIFAELEKWRAIRTDLVRICGVLEWVTCEHGWCASVGDIPG